MAGGRPVQALAELAWPLLRDRGANPIWTAGHGRPISQVEHGSFPAVMPQPGSLDPFPVIV